MNKSLILASLVAAVALAACGKKEECDAGRRPGCRCRFGRGRCCRLRRFGGGWCSLCRRSGRCGCQGCRGKAVDAAASAAKQ